jgi:hypothetical protein
MKKYLLLRNNRTSGPYTIEQLGSIGLLPLDLIWKESESMAWKYPEEMEELKDLIKDDAVENTRSLHSDEQEKSFTLLPSGCTGDDNNDEDPWQFHNKNLPALKANDKTSFGALKENYKASKQKQPVWNRRMLPAFQLARVAAIFVGVVLGAFVIRKMVDDDASDATEETAIAMPVLDRETQKQPDENIKNALVTEIVPVYKNTAKTSKHIPVKKQLKLKASEYKVGLFGGINGLQLTLFNTSSQVVDRAIVAVDYLKPNGSIVQSENVLFSSIRPKGAQTIAIPGSNRGVKVRYKVLKVYAHAYKPELKEV